MEPWALPCCDMLTVMGVPQALEQFCGIWRVMGVVGVSWVVLGKWKGQIGSSGRMTFATAVELEACLLACSVTVELFASGSRKQTDLLPQ